jgi:quinol monooxygenase YgiN
MLGAILRPEHRDAFVQALIEHGGAAVPTEPHTVRFDVIADQGDPNLIFLYEAYANPDAFSTHLNGESHQQFVQLLSQNDWLTGPLAGPPRPFALFVPAVGQSEFAIDEPGRRNRAPH